MDESRQVEQIRVESQSNTTLRAEAEQLVSLLAANGDENPQLRAFCPLATYAADFISEFALSPTLEAASYLHVFVYNDLIRLADIEAVCGQRVAWPP